MNLGLARIIRNSVEEMQLRLADKKTNKSMKTSSDRRPREIRNEVDSEIPSGIILLYVLYTAVAL